MAELKKKGEKILEEIIVCQDLHPDIEVGKGRTAQEILIEIPENGVNANTGLIVFINGYNADAYDEYPRKILKPYLANKYNCLVLDSNYFGLRRAGSFWPTESLINNYNIIYSQNINKKKYSKENDNSKIENYLLSQIITELSKKDCTALDLRCQFMIKRKDNSYESWGYIPAIDLLNYAGMLMQKYKLNRKKIILFGMSYGGYIAKLMGKFAPHTFSVIIDKAGFSRIQLEHMVGHEVKRPDYETEFADANGNKKLIYCSYDNPWTIMEYGTQNYFGDANRLIRSLLIERHRQTSDTKYYIFHSVTDDIAPIRDCDREMDILKKYNRVHYERIDASMIGKTIFKSDRHDLSVSTSELFDYVAEIDGSSLEKESEDNDFTLQSGYTFDCGGRNYVFRYSDDYKLSVHIEKK